MMANDKVKLYRPMNCTLKKLLSRSLFLFSYAALMAAPFSWDVKAIVNNKVLQLQWPKTEREIVRGLGGQKLMAPNQGMLFVLNGKSPQWIWMKDMEFPLDILWIAGKRIVGISQNVPVKTNGQWTRVYSKVPVDKIVEINAGTAETLGLATGQHVRIESP